MANCKDNGHIFGERGLCVFCHAPSKPVNDESNALPPIVAPMPTTVDVTNSVKSTIKDSIKAVVVLSSMLRKLDLQGYAVADELLGNLQVAYAIADHLPTAAQIESLTREKANMKAAITDYQTRLDDWRCKFFMTSREKESLTRTVTLLDAGLTELRAELDAAKRNLAGKYLYFKQRFGPADKTTKALSELIDLNDTARARPGTNGETK